MTKAQALEIAMTYNLIDEVEEMITELMEQGYTESQASITALCDWDLL